MKYQYGEFDGQPFATPDSLFPHEQVVEFILQYGQDALDAMADLKDEDQQAVIQAMIEAGLLERDEKTGELRLTPRMVRGLENKALLEIFRNLRQGTRDGHDTVERGRSPERGEGSKPYAFGDPVHELDLAATLRNAVRRQSADSGGQPIGPPITLAADDLEVFHTEGQTDCATVVLLDMSGSMMRWGRFYHAKQVALGMSAMIRRQFPLDTIDYVGFSSTAQVIPESQLALVMPKPVSLHDPVVRLRAPLDQAAAKPEMIPQHFTNLQMGLRLARQILNRRGGANKQVFIITDGEPTAHIEPGPTGEDMLYLLYPPTEHTADVTLKEALRCQQQGIRMATFALVEDYWGMDWVGFVDKLTRLVRGAAFYCSSDNLSSTVVESYLTGRKRKSFIH